MAIGATLTSLAKVRSWRAEELARFLQALHTRLNELRQWQLDERPVFVRQTAIEQFVFTQRRRARLREPGRDDRKDAPQFPSSPDYELRAELYEQPGGVEDRELLRWEQALRSKRRQVVIGAPGSGKSFTTKDTVLRVAEQSLATLQAQTRPYREIELPLWLTAATLAQYGDYDDAAAALIQAVRDEYKDARLAEIFYRWLQERLASAAPLLIVIDALDELQSGEETGFEKAVRLLDKQLDKPKTRLILTCRTLQWGDKRGLVPSSFGADNVVEIAPLRPQQQRAFVAQLLGHHDGAEKMTNLLQANTALQLAARTPLVLFFACLARHEITEHDTYSSIYALVVRKLFNREHHREGKPHWAGCEEDEEAYLLLLRQIAWALFKESPGRLNRFTLTQWQTAARATGYAPPETHAFLKELRRIGLLVTAGLTAKKKERQWSFAHRSVWEYLAAWGLSEEPNWLVEARQHFWYDQPEWLETIVLLAGLVDDARSLLDALGAEEDDLFGWKHFLAARFIGAANLDEDKYIEPLIEMVCDWLGEWHNLPPQLLRGQSDTYVYQPLLRTLTNSLRQSNRAGLLVGKRIITPLLGALRDDADKWVRMSAALALGELGVGSDAVVTALLTSLRDEANGGIRGRAAADALEALGVGSEAVVTALLTSLRDEADDWVRESAAYALGALGVGSDAVVTALLTSLRDDADSGVRWSAAAALGKLGVGSDTVVTALLTSLGDDADKNRMSAALALGELGVGSDAVVTALLTSLRDDADKWMRMKAAEALGELGVGSDAVVTALLTSLRDEAYEGVRWSAALALGALGVGSDAVVTALLTSLRDDAYEWVRRSAAAALGALGVGSEAVVTALLTSLREDAEERVRGSAAAALRALGVGSDTVVTALLTSLRDDAHEWVGSAALALGALGVGSEAVVTALLALLRDDAHDWVRESAALALGALGVGSEAVVTALLALLRDDAHEGVRGRAADALWRIARLHRKIVRPDGRLASSTAQE